MQQPRPRRTRANPRELGREVRPRGRGSRPDARPIRLGALLALAFLPLASGTAALDARPLQPAPPGRTAFRTYGVERGFGDFTVVSLLQDRKGFLWAGTENGAFRFDGRDFQMFGREQGLASTYVIAIHQTPDEVLWLGTYQGLARKVPGGFEATPERWGLPAETVNALASTSDGRLWVAQRSGLFVRTDEDRFEAAPGWPGGNASAVAVARAGRLWVAALSTRQDGPSGVFSFDGSAWRSWTVPGLGSERVEAIAADGEGRVWVRSSSRLFVLEQASASFTPVVPPEPIDGSRGRLWLDGSGRLMVPVGSGLLRHRADGWQLLGPREGLPTGFAYSALEDREGSLWVGSTGLHRQLGGGVWRGYRSVDGLPSDVVRALLRDRAGNLWVGTDKGLARAHAKGFELLPGTERDAVRTIQEGPDGVLYMAGAPMEVLRYDPRTRRLERFGVEAGLRGNRIFRMVLDRSGTLWVATDGGGLRAARTGPGPLRFEPVVLPGGEEDEYVNGMILDGDGRLWVASRHGVAMLEAGRWRRFTRADGLKQDHTAYLLARRSGEIVVAYFEALGPSRLRYADGRIEVSDLTGGDSPLAAQKIYVLGEDRDGNVWAGTTSGVFRLSGGVETHFRSEDGLVGEDLNNMTFLADEEGDLWFGTMSGLARFDPHVKAPPPLAPTTAILSASLGRTAWDGPPPDGERLSHRENTLELHYAGLSFVRENAVRSETRLVGLEPEWRPTRAREIRISALPPGTYRFEVRSRVGSGPFGPVAGFGFVVTPAWWQTWWFRVLAGLALAGLVVLGVSLRLRGLRRQTQRLESLVAERTQELKEAAEALRNQSLTDPLTGLRNRRYLGVCVPEDVAMVNRNHRNVAIGIGSRATVNIDLVFLMVDVDHFKKVNDEYGHHAGDEVLQQLAALLRSATRESDTVVRWGGEEFLVVGRNACRKECAGLAERIRARVEAHEFRLSTGETLRRTCSVGFAFYPLVESPPDHVEWEQVIDVADHALYAAKHGGRNAWVGLFPRDGLDAGQVPRMPAPLVETMIEDGRLLVVSSLADVGALSFKPSGA